MSQECVNGKKNLGKSRCNKLPGMIRTMITTPIGFKITPENCATTALLKAALQAAIIDTRSNRIYAWPDFVSLEDISSEAAYEDTTLAYLHVHNGQYRYRGAVSKNLCLHKAMFTHNSNEDRVILVDTEGQIFGTEDSDGNFMGFKLQLLNMEKLKLATGAEATKSPIVLALANNKEIDVSGLLVEAGTVIDELEKLTDVELTIVGSPSATTIVVDVKNACDGSSINGLVHGDFKITDDDNGANHAIVSRVEVDGRYTLTGVAFETSKLTLQLPSALSLQAYESLAAVQVTI